MKESRFKKFSNVKVLILRENYLIVRSEDYTVYNIPLKFIGNNQIFIGLNSTLLVDKKYLSLLNG
jgi:hypothetical protein